MQATPEMGIAPRLRAARERLGLSREALAYHSGISWSAIAQAEAGRRTNLRPRTLLALAHTLGVTIDYLVAGGAEAGSMLQHRALFYDTNDAFVAIAAPFLAEGLERSEAALAVTSAARIKSLQDRLGAQAGAVQFAEHSTWYRTPAAALDGYRQFMTKAVDAGATWIRILGEPVWAGRSKTEVRLWARYESLLNLVFSGAPVTVLCPYDTQALDASVLDYAHATHPHATEHETLIPSPHYADPGTFVLQP
jgi:transcriptional regulator with XRE-family HTH domain